MTLFLLPGNKITLFSTITIVSKSLNKFSSTLLLLKRKRLQVNYPFPLTDLHHNLQALSTLQFTDVCKKLFDSVCICDCYRLP